MHSLYATGTDNTVVISDAAALSQLVVQCACLQTTLHSIGVTGARVPWQSVTPYLHLMACS